MADRVEVILSAKDEFSRIFNSLAVKAGTVSGVVSASLTKAFDLTGASLRGLVSIAGQAIQAANEQEDAEKKLTVALGFRSRALIDQATALQRVTIYEDNQIIQAQAAIAMYVKDEGQIKAVTKATLDFASAKGIDLFSASQLVAKTLGTETNALARQGIQVDGAVGSTERLNSVVSNLSKLFGGQAAAAAETFSGKTVQAKNALGELYEEVGGVITRNTFFIKGLDLVKQYLERASIWVNNNRLMLMNLTKDGIVNLMVGMGRAIEVMRFFHNGWLGLKIVGNGVAIVFAESLRIIFEGLRLVLLPLDLIYKGMVQLGVIASNPFDKASEAIGQFQLSSRDVMSDVIKETEAANRGYDIAGKTIGDMTEKLKGFQVEQTAIAREAAIRPMGITPVEDKPKEDGWLKRWEAQRRSAEEATIAEGERSADQFQSDILSLADFYATKEDYRQLDLIRTQQVNGLISESAAQEATNRLLTEAKYNQQLLQMKMAVAGQVVGLLRTMGGASKMAAIAAITLEKGLAIGQIFMNTQVASMRALAELGPIAGPPMAATIQSWGKISAALVAAQGLGEIGQASGVFGGGGVSPGAPGGQPIQTELIPSSTGAKTPQNVTIQVYSLDPSSVNWDKLYEEQINPAINRGADRNIQVQANVVGA